MRFSGKCAVVTGAGSGIGSTVTERLAGEGATVFALDRAWRTRPEASNVHCLDVDVTDEAAVTACFATATDRCGAINLVFNNAAIGISGTRLHETSLADFDKVLNVNVRGAFIVLRAALAAMLGSGGAIVNTASVAAIRATPMTQAYPLTKAAVDHLTRQAAAEYAASQIRVNSVCPGTTDTPLVASAGQEIITALVNSVPLGRMATTTDIANVVLFLLSDEAAYVTGSSYVVDGGYLLNG